MEINGQHPSITTRSANNYLTNGAVTTCAAVRHCRASCATNLWPHVMWQTHRMLMVQAELRAKSGSGIDACSLAEAPDLTIGAHADWVSCTGALASKTRIHSETFPTLREAALVTLP